MRGTSLPERFLHDFTQTRRQIQPERGFVTPGTHLGPGLLQNGRQFGLIEIVALHNLTELNGDSATVACVFTGKTRKLAAASVVMVTTMEPVDNLYHALAAREAEWADHGVRRIVRIGDNDVANVYDYMAATRNNEPGDTVAVIVLRNGKEVSLQVTLAAP